MPTATCSWRAPSTRSWTSSPSSESSPRSSTGWPASSRPTASIEDTHATCRSPSGSSRSPRTRREPIVPQFEIAAGDHERRPRRAHQLRAGHVRLPAQPAHPRPRRVAHRRRDLRQPGPAHPHQAAAEGVGAGPHREPHRDHPVAPGPGRGAARGRPDPHHHGVGGDHRRHRGAGLPRLRGARAIATGWRSTAPSTPATRTSRWASRTSGSTRSGCGRSRRSAAT